MYDSNHVNDSSNVQYDEATIPVFARWFGSWQISVRRRALSSPQLASSYDLAASGWSRKLDRLGFPSAYETLLRRVLGEKAPKAAGVQLRVLDCGVGTGALSCALARVLPVRFKLDAIDVSPRMLEQASNNLRGTNLEVALRHGNVRKLPYDNGAFDLVITAHVLEHLFDPGVALGEMVADQSVVALENARLIHETQQMSTQLTEMNQSLQERVETQVAELERLSTLRRFLPDQVAELVLTEGNEAFLSSHRRKIAALFCDLRGFTAFSETSEPEEVMEVLDEFYSLTGKVVSDHAGTITNRAGDGLMVVLNDPLPVENAADAAVRLAIEMRAVLLKASQRWQELGYRLGIGIGLSTGYATLGLVGSGGQYDYTAVGTVVNMASRLCSEAAHGQILATQKLITECSAKPDGEEIGEQEIEGVARQVRLYEIKLPSGSDAVDGSSAGIAMCHIAVSV